MKFSFKDRLKNVRHEYEELCKSTFDLNTSSELKELFVFDIVIFCLTSSSGFDLLLHVITGAAAVLKSLTLHESSMISPS